MGYDYTCPYILMDEDTIKCFLLEYGFSCGGTECMAAKEKERATNDTKREEKKKA